MRIGVVSDVVEKT